MPLFSQRSLESRRRRMAEPRRPTLSQGTTAEARGFGSRIKRDSPIASRSFRSLFLSSTFETTRACPQRRPPGPAASFCAAVPGHRRYISSGPYLELSSTRPFNDSLFPPVRRPSRGKNRANQVGSDFPFRVCWPRRVARL